MTLAWAGITCQTSIRRQTTCNCKCPELRRPYLSRQKTSSTFLQQHARFLAPARRSRAPRVQSLAAPARWTSDFYLWALGCTTAKEDTAVAVRLLAIPRN